MARVIPLLAAAFALFSACAGSGPPAAPGMQGPSPAALARPAWVGSPEAAYPRSRFITAVGRGDSSAQAERDALARIVAVFGQSVQAEMEIVATFSEAVRDGVIHAAEDIAMREAIATSAQMDTLVGAEIGGTWHDAAAGMYYAIAVMEKERTAALYADLIRSNERIIQDLVGMEPHARNSLDGVARYRLAAVIADANRVYANVLTVVGDTRGINPAEMRRGDDFRIAAAEIVRNIPIGIAVAGDRDGRIRSAFAAVVTRAGFRSGGEDSRYVIRASYNVFPAVIPGQPNQFVRFELSAALEDAAGGNAALFAHPPITGREGHLTLPEAEERALRAAERRIAAEFDPAFRAYLDALMTVQRN